MNIDKVDYLNNIIEKCYNKLNKGTNNEINIRHIISICSKLLNNIKLSVDDLNFLYEVDSIIITDIKGFGKSKKIIKSFRNNIEDYKLIYNYKDNEITDNLELYIKNPYQYKCFISNSTITDINFIMPYHLVGNIDITIKDNIPKLPIILDGILTIRGLESYKELVLPNKVMNNLELINLKYVRGLVLPSYIGGDLILNHVISLGNYKLPSKLGGNLHLNSITSSDNFKIPNPLEYDIYLNDCVITPNNLKSKIKR